MLALSVAEFLESLLVPASLDWRVLLLVEAFKIALHVIYLFAVFVDALVSPCSRWALVVHLTGRRHEDVLRELERLRRVLDSWLLLD
jgi:hypothetical protein